MNLLARAGLFALLAARLSAQPAVSGFHAVCPYDSKLCADFDALRLSCDRNGADIAMLQQGLIAVARRTQDLVVEQAETWPLKDDGEVLKGVFAGLGALRERLDALTASRGAGVAGGQALLQREKETDGLFARLPGKSESPAVRQAFLASVVDLQGKTGGLAGRGAGGPRLDALRDALATLVLVAGVSVDGSVVGKEAMLRSRTLKAGDSADSNPGTALGGEKSTTGNAATLALPGTPAAKGLKTIDVPASGSFSTRINALPYEPKVKSYLTLIAENSDGPDVESTISSLEKFKTKITVSPFNTLKPMIAEYDLLTNTIVLTPGYEIPLPSGKSYRYVYSDEELSGNLMHEVQHRTRHGEGGGANEFTNERDAFNIQNRFYIRFQQKHSGQLRLDRNGSKMLESWHYSPDGFEDQMTRDYMEGDSPEIREGEVSIDDQESAVKKRLASLESSMDVLSQMPHAAEIAAHLREELKMLARDRELSKAAERYQREWRYQVGFERRPKGE